MEPLAGGLLSGKYRRHQPPPADARLASGYREPPVPDEARLFDIRGDRVRRGRLRCDAGAGGVAYTLTRPGVTSLVVGARRMEQLLDNLGSADLVLTDEDVQRIERVSRPAVPYPYWHQLMWDVDRFGQSERPFREPYLADGSYRLPTR